jgi:hypothetical protein
MNPAAIAAKWPAWDALYERYSAGSVRDYLSALMREIARNWRVRIDHVQ